MTLVQHEFLKIIGELKLKQAQILSTENMLHYAFSNKNQYGSYSNDNIIYAYELSIIELWYEENKKSSNRVKKKLQIIYKDCFNILINLEIPQLFFDKIMHVIKLVTYGYLSNQWHIVRQFLIEHQKELSFSDDLLWPERILCSIYYSVLNIICRNKINIDDIDSHIKNIKNVQYYNDKKYLNGSDNVIEKSFYLLSLYKLLEMTDMIYRYMNTGKPSDIKIKIKNIFQDVLTYVENSDNIEIAIITHMLYKTFKKMLENSIWNVIKNEPSLLKFFKYKLMSDESIFELLYPQTIALASEHIDIKKNATIINLPTSSGKTLIAECKIVQMYEHMSSGIIVYVVPTKTLVNQITSTLKKDLEPLNIKTVKIQGIRNIDTFENEIINRKQFDVLVTTPEKLNLLFSQRNNDFINSIKLCIIDEAHNIANKKRGLTLEILLATMKKDHQNIKFLLLTPFMKNGKAIAEWLDPIHNTYIPMTFDWKPNDKVIGMYYRDNDNNSNISFQPLKTHNKTIISQFDKVIPLDKINNNNNIDIKKLYKLSILASTQFQKQKSVIIICKTVKQTWMSANILFHTLIFDKSRIDYYMKENIERPISKKIKLVQRYIEVEFGKEFPLIKYLGKGIGVHNSALPDDILKLIEKLFLENELDVLMSTTTIAQGINFPASVVLISDIHYSKTQKMSPDEFWNIAGRAGRINQKSIGIVGIAAGEKNKKKITKFVKRKIPKLKSSLPVIIKNLRINAYQLKKLSKHSECISFIQHITHLKNQYDTIEDFNENINMNLSDLYGYNQLINDEKKLLLMSISCYGESLYEHENRSELSEQTGFSSETIDIVRKKLQDNKINSSILESEILITESPKIIKAFTEIMQNMPEIHQKMNIKQIPNHTDDVLYDWIHGEKIIEISNKYFGGIHIDQVTDCVQAIYKNLRSSASWGISCISKTIIYDHSITDNNHMLKNIPSKLYYGVNTNQAVLLCMLDIPRSIAIKMGKRYLKEHDENTLADTYALELIEAWVLQLTNEDWEEFGNEIISGSEYRKIWQMIVNP